MNEERFGDVFDRWMRDHGFQNNYIADKLNISATAVSHWRNGRGIPRNGHLMVLRGMGLNWFPTGGEDGVLDLAKAILEIKAENSLSLLDLSELTGISQSTLHKFLNKQGEPRIQILFKLERFVKEYGKQQKALNNPLPNIKEIEKKDEVEIVVTEVEANEEKNIADAELVVVDNKNELIAPPSAIDAVPTTGITLRELYVWAERHDALDAKLVFSNKFVDDYSLSIGKCDNAKIDLKVGA